MKWCILSIFEDSLKCFVFFFLEPCTSSGFGNKVRFEVNR